MKYIELHLERNYHSSNGKIKRERLYELSNTGWPLRLHNPDGPAFRRWNEDGLLLDEQYCINGLFHREDGPAIRKWETNDNIEQVSFWNKGRRHREDGPAFMLFNDLGQLLKEKYYIGDKLHREDGPAIVKYRFIANKNMVVSERYFLNDQELSKERFENRNQSCGGKVVEIDGKKYKLTEV